MLFNSLSSVPCTVASPLIGLTEKSPSVIMSAEQEVQFHDPSLEFLSMH